MKKPAVILLVLLLLFAMPATYAESNSWAHINQEIVRPLFWRQLVGESPFQLGDIHDGIQDYGAYPSMDGSTVAVPMAVEFARQHLRLTEADIESFVFFSTTHSAYEHLILRRPNPAPKLPSRNAVMDAMHPVDLIIATAPSDEEQALAKACGVTLLITPVCLDAFVFITHRDNPVQSLTVDEIRAIYRGEITNWAEVGGNDDRIAAYQREKNSGSQTAMETLVMQGAPMARAPVEYTSAGMGHLVEMVGQYRPSETSLGYTYLYYIDTLYKNDNIKVLAIDGIAPEPDNLRSGAYPFTTAYHAVMRGGEENAAAGKFIAWMLSPEGQQVIEQAGYIPVEEAR